jgi:hypothetical protein
MPRAATGRIVNREYLPEGSRGGNRDAGRRTFDPDAGDAARYRSLRAELDPDLDRLGGLALGA